MYIKGNTNMELQQLKALLSEYNIVIGLDSSGSMATKDTSSGKTRWLHMQELVVNFANSAASIQASAGIDLIRFGGKTELYKGITPESVNDLFAKREPNGGTPMGEAIEQALAIAAQSSKKSFIAFFTDGVPDSKEKVEASIAKFTQGLDDTTKDNTKILFVQVGKDLAAASFLDELDNALPGAKYDIVNAKSTDKAGNYNSIAELIDSAIKDEH